MDITAERSKQVDFTQPYYANSAIVIAPKGKFTAIDALKGKRIGVENGTTHQKYLQDKHPEINVVAYDSYQNAILDMKSGRLDGVFGDSAVVNQWLKPTTIWPASVNTLPTRRTLVPARGLRCAKVTPTAG